MAGQSAGTFEGGHNGTFTTDLTVTGTTLSGTAVITVNDLGIVVPTTVSGDVTCDGTVTFGCQTHPADGNAGALVCDRERAREWSKDPRVTVRLVAAGQARAKKGFMAMAVVPAAQAALKHAGIALADVAAIKTHNPFAVNDVYFARELDLDFAAFNRYGSPLVYGHPQGPTGLRATIELVEELILKGGGYGLFAGCAAGDTAMALVVRVN